MWRGQKTPNLAEVFLVGATLDNIETLQNVTTPSTFNATLDEEIPDDNTTAGFCFHETNLSFGCKYGHRFENHIGLSSSEDISSYLKTYQVVYIIRCW